MRPIHPVPEVILRRRAELAAREARRPSPRPSPPEPPLPPLVERVRNVAGAMGRAAVAVARGEPLKVADEMREARLAVCREGRGLGPGQVKDGHCDHYRASDGACGGAGGCGCYVRTKAALASERCPLGRWPTFSP